MNDEKCFAGHLDEYAKATARQDWSKALSCLERAIDDCPTPVLLGHIGAMRAHAARMATQGAWKAVFMRLTGRGPQ